MFISDLARWLNVAKDLPVLVSDLQTATMAGIIDIPSTVF